MPAGRPLKFKTPEELQEKISEYFALCEKRGTQPFITELAYHLDTSRETLVNYEEKNEYFDTIKKAKLRCELAIEKRLNEGKSQVAGLIFNLKNNYGWRDRTEQDITSAGKPLPILGGLSTNNRPQEGTEAQETA